MTQRVESYRFDPGRGQRVSFGPARAFFRTLKPVGVIGVTSPRCHLQFGNISDDKNSPSFPQYHLCWCSCEASESIQPCNSLKKVKPSALGRKFDFPLTLGATPSGSTLTGKCDVRHSGLVILHPTEDTAPRASSQDRTLYTHDSNA